MMIHLLRSTLKFGPIVGSLVASAAGCFAFTRGFELIAKEGEESELRASSRACFRNPGIAPGTWTHIPTH